ncbi:MAG: molybdopterin-dependent oxidoreductase [Deltaproteobacteria bacterium]|nr:molybdopterin-dependent oxidoreductase [Deltaproteobacteria bacterium]
MHADLWLNPKVGTDAALSLAMAQVILDEELHDVEYVREQTDLPLLVRDDTGRYLRESDLRAGGSDATLYFWDEVAGRPAVVPGCEGDGGRSLRLGDLRPALAGAHSVELADGGEVSVRPLFERLQAHLTENYSPDQASQITGVGADTIRSVARQLAAARRDPADGPHRQSG